MADTSQKQPDSSEDTALIPVKASRAIRRLELAEKIAAALALCAKASGYEGAFLILMGISFTLGFAAYVFKIG
jgi:hypothetical protein